MDMQRLLDAMQRVISRLLLHLERATHTRSDRTCSSDLYARAAVEASRNRRPTTWNDGSKPEVMTMPPTTGMSAQHTRYDSMWPLMSHPSNTVNAGVVAPTACEPTAAPVRQLPNQLFIANGVLESLMPDHEVT